MDLHRHHARPLTVVEVVLLGPGDALDHRVHQLQVAGVGRQGQVHAASLASDEVVGVPLVVLDVSLVLRSLAAGRALELAQDHLVGLVEDVGQHVQAAPVGHADDHLLHAHVRALHHQGVEQGQQGVGALYGEALLADVAGVEEALEFLRLDELPEDAALLGMGEGGLVEGGLDALQEPALLLRVRSPHGVDAEGAAVGGLELVDQVAQGAVGLAAEGAEADPLVQVFLGDAELRQLQVRIRGAVIAQGIEIGQVVAAVTVRAHDGHHALVRALPLAALGSAVQGPLPVAPVDDHLARPSCGGHGLPGHLGCGGSGPRWRARRLALLVLLGGPPVPQIEILEERRPLLVH